MSMMMITNRCLIFPRGSLHFSVTLSDGRRGWNGAEIMSERMILGWKRIGWKLQFSICTELQTVSSCVPHCTLSASLTFLLLAARQGVGSGVRNQGSAVCVIFPYEWGSHFTIGQYDFDWSCFSACMSDSFPNKSYILREGHMNTGIG